MPRLSPSFRGALRTFSFWVANGSLGRTILEGIEYRSILVEEPSALEQLYAIFSNVIELDEMGTVLNAKQAERRAAQWLRSYIDPAYVVTPELAGWEVELHDGPPPVDPK